VNFNDNLIKIFHPFELNSKGEIPYYNKNLEMPYQFILVGHHHCFDINPVSREIKIPTLSILDNDSKHFRGFVELIDEGEEYLFKLYDYEAKYVKEDQLVKNKRPY
jgi:hypothetical protein